MATASSQPAPPAKQAPLWMWPQARALLLRALQLRALQRRARRLGAEVQAEATPNDLRRHSADPRQEQQDVRPYPAWVWEPKRRAWRPAKEFFARPALEVEGLPETEQLLRGLSPSKGSGAPGFVFPKQGPGLSRPVQARRHSLVQPSPLVAQAQAPPQPSTPVPELLRAASSEASREPRSLRQPAAASSAASWPALSRQQQAQAQEQARAQVRRQARASRARAAESPTVATQPEAEAYCHQ